MKNLTDRLLSFDVDELIEAAFRLGLPGLPSDGEKAKWAAHVASGLETSGENLQLMLTLPEYQALRDHLRQGLTLYPDPEAEDYDALMDAMRTLEAYALVYWDGAWRVDERVPGWLMLEEDDLSLLRLQDNLFDYMQGWLLHVGMMPMWELFQRASALLDSDDESEREEIEALCCALHRARCGFDGLFIDDEDVEWAIHTTLADPPVLRERLRQPVMADVRYPDFNDDALAFAGGEAFIPGDLKAYLPLLDFLDDHDVEDVDELVRRAVLLAENERPDEGADLIIGKLEKLDANDVRKAGVLIRDLFSCIPRWYHKGHPSAAPQADSKPRRRFSMPGSGDPCPCGSGRAYRQCCGKRIN